MTVKELIEELKKCDENLEVYAEGEPANKVLVEIFKGEPQIVRIFKTWDVDFVNSPCQNCQEFDCHGCDHFCKEGRQ